MPEIRVPELQHPDIANTIFKARADSRADKAMQMQEEIFKQEQDPMSTQNQLRKMQLEKVRGDVLRDTLHEAVTNLGAIDWDTPDNGDWKSYQNHYDQRLQALGFDQETIPPGMRFSPIYKTGANGVQSTTIDKVATQRRAREIQENLRHMEAKPTDPTANIGLANLAYRIDRDNRKDQKDEQERADDLYRMIAVNADKPDVVRKDVDEFNKKSDDYQFVYKPDETKWWRPDSYEKWTGKTPPKYVAVPKGFTLEEVKTLSAKVGKTPEEFVETFIQIKKANNQDWKTARKVALEGLTTKKK